MQVNNLGYALGRIVKRLHVSFYIESQNREEVNLILKGFTWGMTNLNTYLGDCVHDPQYTFKMIGESFAILKKDLLYGLASWLTLLDSFN